MVIHRFLPESDEESRSTKKSRNKSGKIKAPDFIYVDDVPLQNKQDESSNEETLSHLDALIGSNSYPFFMRPVMFIIASILTVLLGVLISLFLIVTVIAAVLFFQSVLTIQIMRKLWAAIVSVSAYALAFFVATLSPAFGCGILALYVLQNGGSLQQMPFVGSFKDRF